MGSVGESPLLLKIARRTVSLLFGAEESCGKSPSLTSCSLSTSICRCLACGTSSQNAFFVPREKHEKKRFFAGGATDGDGGGELGRQAPPGHADSSGETSRARAGRGRTTGGTLMIRVAWKDDQHECLFHRRQKTTVHSALGWETRAIAFSS